VTNNKWPGEQVRASVSDNGINESCFSLVCIMIAYNYEGYQVSDDRIIMNDKLERIWILRFLHSAVPAAQVKVTEYQIR